MTKIETYFEESSKQILRIIDEKKDIEKCSKLIVKTVKNNRNILLIGNGGSFAEAEHFSGELNCTFNKKNRKAISAISLGSNSTALTAWANDFDYKTYYSRQIQAMGKKGDLLIILTTSGYEKKDSSSENLYLALKVAKKMGIRVISMVGKNGGKIKLESDISIHIKSNITSIIQECHLSLIHYFCYELDSNF